MKKPNRLKTIIALVVMLLLLVAIEQFRNSMPSGTMLVMVTQKALIFAIVAVSMNLLTGFTGLFSLGQAGFMAIGAYTTAILTIPVDRVDGVYYMNGIAPWLLTLKQALAALPQGLVIIFALLLGGAIAGLFAFLIGIPVLKLKSDYLAIATLGFSEIVRAIFSAPQLDKVTNGSYGLNNIPGFSLKALGLPEGTGLLVIPFIMATLLIYFIVLVLQSSYGRAFKAIREDEVAAEAMGINLLKHKELAFVISSFITAVAGGMLAMYMGSIEAKTFSTALTYDLLLIVVIGGLGSVTGSVLGAFVVTFSKDWLLRFFDNPLFVGSFQVPLFRVGFRMVIFSLLLMMVVLFYRKGLMGNKEFSWDRLFRRPGRKLSTVPKAEIPAKDMDYPDPGPIPPAPLIPDPPGPEDEVKNGK